MFHVEHFPKLTMSQLALILFFSTILATRPFGPFFGSQGGAFASVIHRQNIGAGTELVPPGSTQLIVEAWAGGAGGNVSPAGRGGSSGSYAKKTIAIANSDWNKSISWVVGAKGSRCGPSNSCSGTIGGNSTVGSIVLNAGTLNIVTHCPTVGTGGDTNTGGNASVGSVGGLPVVGDDTDEAGAGGDGSPHAADDPPGVSSDGSNGLIKFSWN